MKNSNAKGNVWYGLHMYPGVAEYRPPGRDAYRVYLSEDTLREMDPTFSGCPVFVYHADDATMEKPLDLLKEDADGWVSESFFNEADGKHWVRFITCSERAESALRSGMKLSNCYVPKSFGPGGEWNGVEYQRQVTAGDYEHLAIVPDPRYAESEVLTPEAFKSYNEGKRLELARLQNNRETPPMLNFLKRNKLENDKAKEFEGMSVMLPKSGREVEIVKLVNEADDHEMAKRSPQMANGDHQVELAGSKMTVNELVEKHNKMCQELEDLKKKNESGDASGDDDTVTNADDDDKADKEKAAAEAAEKEKADKAKNAADKKVKDDAAAAKKAADKEAADKIRNAKADAENQPQVIETAAAQVERGKDRY